MSVPDIVGLVVSVLSWVGPVLFPQWQRRRRYGLRVAELRPKSMMEVAREVRKKISISYSGSPVDNIVRSQFIVHNTGFSPLEEKHISKPITWRAPGKIHAWRVPMKGPRRVDLFVRAGDEELEITWTLFNQRLKAIVEVIHEGGTDREYGEVSGIIKNIPEVDFRKMRWQSQSEQPDDLDDRGSRARRLMAFLFRYRMVKSFYVHSEFFRFLYFFVYFMFLFVIALTDVLGLSGWVATTVCASVFLSTWWMWRNPYSSFLRKHRKSQAEWVQVQEANSAPIRADARDDA